MPNVVIDGVQHKISVPHYDWLKQQKQISPCVTVVKDDKVSQIKSAATPMNPKDAVVERLIGHTNVVYYDCETTAWNTAIYNGCVIDAQRNGEHSVKRFKSELERIPEFNRHYEFVASVTMTIDEASFPGVAGPISNPQYSNNGLAVVVNVIVKNKETGEYELYCKSWIGVSCFHNQYGAASCGANLFANAVACWPKFRHKLMCTHKCR